LKPNNFFFHTRNLQFSPLSLKESDKLHHLWASEAIRDVLWGNEPVSIEQSKSIIRDSKKLFKKENLGLWTVKLTKTNSFIGFGGFWYLQESPDRQLIFAVEREYWGHGYATEIARALIHFGFHYGHISQVLGINRATNPAASRVLQKAALLFKRQQFQDGVNTVYYEILKSRWAPDGSLEFTTPD